MMIAVAVARAQPPAQQRAQARELYTNGQQLFRQGDFSGAQRAFEEAYRVVPNPVVLLSIAECYARTEQYQKAIDTLRTYLAERANAPDRAQVEAQIQTLQSKPAVLTVQSNVTGAAIIIDSQDSGHTTPADLSLAPGEHSVALDFSGYVPAQQSVNLAPGGRDSVLMTLIEEPPAAVAETQVTEPAPKVEAGRHATPAFWVAIGFTVAGTVTGAVLGGLALKKNKEYDDNPTSALADKGERLALFSDVGTGVAVAGAVTALVLYLTSGSKGAPAGEQQATETPQAWSLQPSIAKNNYGLAGTLRF
jgi:tetratricopeptide (TPR) repeat protein